MIPVTSPHFRCSCVRGLSQKVTYESRDGGDEGIVNTGPEDSDEEEESKAAAAELWDVTRPLEGNCLLELKTFADPEGKMVCAALFHLWLHVFILMLKSNLLFGTIHSPVRNMLPFATCFHSQHASLVCFLLIWICVCLC